MEPSRKDRKANQSSAENAREGAELTPGECEHVADEPEISEEEETEQDTRPTSDASGKSNAPIVPPHPRGCRCISCDMKRGT
jgi:hypothetical protein